MGKEDFFMKNKSKTRSAVFKSVKALTIAAMLTAMSVVIGIFCKNFLNLGSGLFRITFENLPIILSGILFGPIIGGIVGAATDLISYFMSTQVYPPNLVVTLGAASAGIVSGIVSRFIVKKPGYFQIILSTSLAHVVGSMIIKSIGLYTYYHMGILWRIPLYFLIAPVEAILICLMYKNSNIRKLFGWT